MSVNANEEMLAGYADPDAGYPDAYPNVTWYADTDADLCIRIMFLCCTCKNTNKAIKHVYVHYR